MEHVTESEGREREKLEERWGRKVPKDSFKTVLLLHIFVLPNDMPPYRPYTCILFTPVYFLLRYKRSFSYYLDPSSLSSDFPVGFTLGASVCCIVVVVTSTSLWGFVDTHENGRLDWLLA